MKKKKNINVIVEGRMLDSDMQQVVGGIDYCTTIPGRPATHIAPPCAIATFDGSYIVNPCPANTPPPPPPPCVMLHSIQPPCIVEPGQPVRHFTVNPLI